MLYGSWHVHGRRGDAWNCCAPWLSAIFSILHALRFGFSQLKKRPVPLVTVLKHFANFGKNKMVFWGFLGVLQSKKLFRGKSDWQKATQSELNVSRLVLVASPCLLDSDSRWSYLRLFVPSAAHTFYSKPAQLVDPKHRVLYELGASTTGDRAFWVETLTKASRYTMGSGDEQRQGALSRRFLITTRAGSRRGMGDGIGGCASGHGPGSTTR